MSSRRARPRRGSTSAPKVTIPIRNSASRAEQVAERAADQEERAERQQVGVDQPLLEGQAAAEVALDRGQRDVHDRRVDEDDDGAENARDEYETVAADGG